MTGDEFRDYRKAIGLTQTELGLLMGMPQQAVGTIELVRGSTKQQAAFMRVIHWLYTRGLLVEYAASIGVEIRVRE